MAKLLVHESAGVREFEIIDNEVHMGRELDNTLRLPDPSISRHHCVIRKLGGGFEIQDLQSSNGVLVNGNRVQASPLRDGDRITLGQVQLTFQDPRPEVAATVAISVMDAPPPSGTVRMSADQLAAIHTGKPSTEPEAKAATPDQLATGPVSTPLARPVPPVAPALPPRPTPPPPPPPSSSAGVIPAFLAAYLPPVPDDAQPTGERGDFLTRFLAVLIDWAIIFVIQLILGMIPFLGCFISPLIGLAYAVFLYYCLVAFRGSIGKKVMKLRVVPEDNPSGNIDASQAVLRFLGHVVNGILLCLPYLMILGSERKGLQDIFSKSICIKVDR
ncbi:MAG: FHA domain-containing protein [Holophagaceae bacterium]|uniref:FHA domain-containing protein n=1 Tax=Candidatus Geothrix skivensis TaxID=2954439 RepID=A0A9D7SJ50_9BACT|nr:FHA domain-containing protein [Candidatus Geothrix skivensis]